MANTATRLLTLIMLLQRRPNQKAADLAQELQVSVRTLHRYMGMLEEMGIPIYSERGPHGGFSLVRGYKMPPMIFSPEEAAAVYLGTSLVEEMWGRLYRDAARSALAKMENVLPFDQKAEVEWAKRSLYASHLHRGDLSQQYPYLEVLRMAMHESKQVRMRYQSRSQPEPTTRAVDPYALVHRWGWWYLAGYCHLRREVRTFRVDRIKEICLLEESFDYPADFDMQAYLQQDIPSEPPQQVQLRFMPEAEQMLKADSAYWDSIDKQADDCFLVSFSSADLNFTASFALSFSPLAEVIAPPELRKIVKERLQAAAQMYQEDKDG